MATRPPEPAPAPWQASLAYGVSRGAFAALYRAESHGGHHVPAGGPVILAANHTGYLDGALVLAMAPRPVHFLVLRENFTGIVGAGLRLAGEIPIDQTRGDRVALGQALEVLTRAGVLGIFPEGGRGRGDLAKAGGGVAWLALRSGAPVVPTACLGTRATGAAAGSWPALRSRMVVDFGPPVHLGDPAGRSGRQRLVTATEAIRTTMVEHIHAAVQRHGIPLPEDVPDDLIDTGA